MKLEQIVAVVSILCLSRAEAFSVAPRSLLVSANRIAQTTIALFSQWDDEEDVQQFATFEDAQRAASEEDAQKELDEMGDFDATSTYNANDIDRYREAIRKRAESIGLEKRSPEQVVEEEAEALQTAVAKGEGLIAEKTRDNAEQFSEMLDVSQLQQLDLTKITSDAPKGPNEDLPSMMYDPTADMTQEEMEEADPIGFKPWNEQIAWVIDKAEFPSPLSVLGETIVTIVTVVVTAVIFTQWDEFCRNAAFHFNMVPRPEDTAKALEGMLAPGDTVLGMGGNSLSGQEMLQLLQDGTKGTIKAVQDGTIKDILAGDIPADL